MFLFTDFGKRVNGHNENISLPEIYTFSFVALISMETYEYPAFLIRIYAIYIYVYIYMYISMPSAIQRA